MKALLFHFQHGSVAICTVIVLKLPFTSLPYAILFPGSQVFFILDFLSDGLETILFNQCSKISQWFAWIYIFFHPLCRRCPFNLLNHDLSIWKFSPSISLIVFSVFLFLCSPVEFLVIKVWTLWANLLAFFSLHLPLIYLLNLTF